MLTSENSLPFIKTKPRDLKEELTIDSIWLVNDTLESKTTPRSRTELLRGTQNMDGQRALELMPLLQERLVILTGGRDRRGGPVLSFPASPRRERAKPEDYKRLLQYLMSIPKQSHTNAGNRCKLFHIADLTPSAKYSQSLH
ncbi:hypothetical protein GEV33_002279 [Tenebrio molitor]|uniref:Uncharacterized protein n=1 Tax=Tenebrio molitor TaxID=7067 RepID=A0A8J6HUG7_TENMO|nr:hypothetical protein GEV33_002279 [Tenebrio molitor]